MTDATIDIRPAIGDDVRRALAVLGDVLVPEAHGMPAASAMDVGGGQLDTVLASRPDLAAPVTAALAGADLSDPEAVLADLRANDPGGYGAVVLAIVAGYYMHPEIHRRIGYPGQVPKDVQRMHEREVYQEGLLDLAARVVERGPVYRPTPEPS